MTWLDLIWLLIKIIPDQVNGRCESALVGRTRREHDQSSRRCVVSQLRTELFNLNAWMHWSDQESSMIIMNSIPDINPIFNFSKSLDLLLTICNMSCDSSNPWIKSLSLPSGTESGREEGSRWCPRWPSRHPGVIKLNCKHPVFSDVVERDV